VVRASTAVLKILRAAEKISLHRFIGGPAGQRAYKRGEPERIRGPVQVTFEKGLHQIPAILRAVEHIERDLEVCAALIQHHGKSREPASIYRTA